MDSEAKERLVTAGKDVAMRVLHTWLPMMFRTRPELEELCEAYGVAKPSPSLSFDDIVTDLGPAFTEAHLPHLVQPAGGAVALLLEEESGHASESAWTGKLQMYWRGALALHKMPEKTLAAMLEKRPHLQDSIEPCAAPRNRAEVVTSDVTADTTTNTIGVSPSRKTQMIKVLLPEYTMVAEDQQTYAERVHQRRQARKKTMEADSAADSVKTEAASHANDSHPDDGDDVHDSDCAGTSSLQAKSDDNSHEKDANDCKAPSVATNQAVKSCKSSQKLAPNTVAEPEAVPSKSLEHTAAAHTYDVGYKKWENFDVDTALNDTDDANTPDTESTTTTETNTFSAEPASDTASETTARQDTVNVQSSTAFATDIKPQKIANTQNSDETPNHADSLADEHGRTRMQHPTDPGTRSAESSCDCDASIVSEPGNSAEWKSAGNAALKSGNFDEAIRAYRRGIAALPSDLDTTPVDSEESTGLVEESGSAKPMSEAQWEEMDKKVAEVEAQEKEKRARLEEKYGKTCIWLRAAKSS